MRSSRLLFNLLLIACFLVLILSSCGGEGKEKGTDAGVDTTRKQLSAVTLNPDDIRQCIPSASQDKSPDNTLPETFSDYSLTGDFGSTVPYPAGNDFNGPKLYTTHEEWNSKDGKSTFSIDYLWYPTPNDARNALSGMKTKESGRLETSPPAIGDETFLKEDLNLWTLSYKKDCFIIRVRSEDKDLLVPLGSLIDQKIEKAEF